MEQAGDGNRGGITVPRALKCVFAQGHRGPQMGTSGDQIRDACRCIYSSICAVYIIIYIKYIFLYMFLLNLKDRCRFFKFILI